jgi:sugar phosphate permease
MHTAAPVSPMIVARTASGFAAFGFFWTGFSVAAPAFKSDFGLSDAGLGAILTGTLALSAVSMLPAAHWADRAGAIRLSRLAFAVLAVTAAGIALAPALIPFVVALSVAGIAGGLVEVGINTAGIQAELGAGRPVLGWLHAGFSAASLLGGLVLSGLVEAGTGRIGVYVAITALVVTTTALLPPQRRLSPSGSPHMPARHTHGVSRALRDPKVAALATVCALGFFAEGAVATWCILYLRRDLNTSAFAAGAAFALFQAAMVGGRLVHPWLSARLTNRSIVGGLGATLVVATAVMVARVDAAPTTAGFFLAGLAVSGVVPSVMAEAGRVAPGQLGSAAGAVVTVGYVGLIVGPLVIGMVADATSLRLGLASVALAGVAMLAVAAWAPWSAPVRIPTR